MGKETYEDASSGSVVPKMQPRLAAETSQRPANGHVPQSQLQLLQQSLLWRIVEWTRFLRLRDQHTLALFLDPLLGEPEVLCLSLDCLFGTGSVSLTLSNSL